MFQVTEEEIESCTDCIVGLELDIPDATCNTDSGSAWPAMVVSIEERHIEDTFHNLATLNKNTLV